MQKKNHLTRTLLVAIGLFMLVTSTDPGCATDQPSQEIGTATLETGIHASQSEAPVLRTFYFECTDGIEVVAHFQEKEDEVILFLPRKTVHLPHVPAASGAKYSDGNITFWTKGEREALLEIGTAGLKRCTENRRKSIIEDAKLRGADFWATGNEPGWTLEIHPESIFFVTNYGRDRYEFLTPVPHVDQQKAVTTYEGQDSGHDFTIQVTETRCADSMSGESFESTVKVTLDGKAYRGCGLALH